MYKKHILEKLYQKIGRHKLSILLCMIIVLCLFDYTSYRMNPHSSMFIGVVKKYQLRGVLEQSQDFYKACNKPLQTDEFVMLYWLWPERTLGHERVFVDDSFDRLYKKSWEKMVGMILIIIY